MQKSPCFAEKFLLRLFHALFGMFHESESL